MAHSTDELVIVDGRRPGDPLPGRRAALASRASGGVRGIKLAHGDNVVGDGGRHDGDQLLTISERGFGKRTPFAQYPTQKRGGGGVLNMKLTDKTGRVSAASPGERHARADHHHRSTAWCCARRWTRFPCIGRNTQGVSIMRMRPGDTVAAIAGIEGPEDETPAAPPPSRRGERDGAREQWPRRRDPARL